MFSFTKLLCTLPGNGTLHCVDLWYIQCKGAVELSMHTTLVTG